MIKYETVYKPNITVPVSIMINNHKAIGIFIAFVRPGALGRYDVRWMEALFFYTWDFAFVWS
jgi:hypothetical protein